MGTIQLEELIQATNGEFFFELKPAPSVLWQGVLLSKNRSFAEILRHFEVNTRLLGDSGVIYDALNLCAMPVQMQVLEERFKSLHISLPAIQTKMFNIKGIFSFVARADYTLWFEVTDLEGKEVHVWLDSKDVAPVPIRKVYSFKWGYAWSGNDLSRDFTVTDFGIVIRK